MWSNIRNDLNGVAVLFGNYEFQVKGTLPHHLNSAVFNVEALARSKQMAENGAD